MLTNEQIVLFSQYQYIWIRFYVTIVWLNRTAWGGVV